MVLNLQKANWIEKFIFVNDISIIMKFSGFMNVYLLDDMSLEPVEDLLLYCDTRLKALRKRAGLSQRELSELSGVPLRTIQQYEQRQKSINKAQAEYLVQLSQVLCCHTAALLEQQ